jgi:hypothetical protein
MWKYRYRREHLGDAELVDQCNWLGEQGWSLVGPPVWVPGDDAQEAAGVWRCFFKRTVTDREQAYEVLHRATTPEEKAAIAAAVAGWERERE